MSEADRRLIEAAMQAGRVTQCPTPPPSNLVTMFGTKGQAPEVGEVEQLLRVERAG